MDKEFKALEDIKQGDFVVETLQGVCRKYPPKKGYYIYIKEVTIAKLIKKTNLMLRILLKKYSKKGEHFVDYKNLKNRSKAFVDSLAKPNLII